MKQSFLKKFKIIFWDFDGVIKDSTSIKGSIFCQLFNPFGKSLNERIRRHHDCNGGMSRYEKIPLYLKWAGVQVTENAISEYCLQFGILAKKAVIDAAWVPGAFEYLYSNPNDQRFFLVTATPQGEIESILESLNIKKCFSAVHGSPLAKSAAIESTLSTIDDKNDQVLLIGDSLVDLDAARKNNISFLLRRHSDNYHIFKEYSGPYFDDFVVFE